MAPIFVGSNNEDSRIRSNRIGFAASTADPGSADEGDGYYNITDNQLKLSDGSAFSAISGGGGTVELTASGTLSNGQTVIVQSDGTVTGVGTTSFNIGSHVTFESAAVQYTAATFDSNSNKVVIAYTDQGNSNYGTAVVGTVSGETISFGTPVVFESGDTSYIDIAFDSTNNKIVIVYTDGGNSDYCTAVVGNVDGTSITFGTPVVYYSSAGTVNKVVFDPNSGNVVVGYSQGASTYYPVVIVGTISGTSISFGSPRTVNSRPGNVALAFDSNQNKVLIAYNDNDQSKGRAKIGTVSGTSITLGAAVDFESAQVSHLDAVFDSTNNKVVIFYRDGGNSNNGTAIVGEIEGIFVTFGTAVVFDTGTAAHMKAAYDSKNNKIVTAFYDQANLNLGYVISGTVSGNHTNSTITFATRVNFADQGRAWWIGAAYDSSNERVVISYEDDYDNDYGKAFVLRNDGTNLTSENFIGFSDADYTNGQTAKIQIVSSIDDAQTGLTTGSLHYVQNDGSLGVAASTPSVVAGTAISGTKISIKN